MESFYHNHQYVCKGVLTDDFSPLIGSLSRDIFWFPPFFYIFVLPYTGIKSILIDNLYLYRTA